MLGAVVSPLQPDTCTNASTRSMIPRVIVHPGAIAKPNPTIRRAARITRPHRLSDPRMVLPFGRDPSSILAENGHTFSRQEPATRDEITLAKLVESTGQRKVFGTGVRTNGTCTGRVSVGTSSRKAARVPRGGGRGCTERIIASSNGSTVHPVREIACRRLTNCSGDMYKLGHQSCSSCCEMP